LELVEGLHVLLLRIRVVKVEVTILNIFGYAVNFELRVVDVNLGVRDGHYIDLTLLSLFFEKRPFSHADTDFHLGTTHVIQCGSHLGALLVDEDVEVDVNVATQCLVHCVFIDLCLFLFFKLAATVSSGLLHLFDVTNHIACTWLIILLHISLTLSRLQKS